MGRSFTVTRRNVTAVDWTDIGVSCSLTFDMRGGRQPAKPDVARPLDGRVRPHPPTSPAEYFEDSQVAPSSGAYRTYTLHLQARTCRTCRVPRSQGDDLALRR